MIRIMKVFFLPDVLLIISVSMLLISIRSENINFRTNTQGIEDYFKIFIIQADTAVSDRHSKKTLVNSTVYQVAVANGKRIIAQYSIFIS